MDYQKNRHYLTLSQAAKATGKSKSVISNALKSGEISYISKDDAGYRIDPAELFRVFPKNDNENRSGYRFRTPEDAIENAIKIKELEVKLEATAQERTFFKDQYAKLEIDRDEWRTQAQRLALTYQKPVESIIAVPATSPAKNRLRLSSGQIFGLAGAIAMLVLGVLFWPDIIARLSR